MKVLVLSDIHGNADALRAVLTAAEHAGAERILNAGDLIGYYHKPSDVLKMLADWPMDCVRGNHESMLARALHDRAFLDDCTKRYGHGLVRAIETLRQDQIDWLVSLPANSILQLGSMRILLAHGTPGDTDAYVYPNAPEHVLSAIDDIARPSRPDIVVLGHTHYQHLWRRKAHQLVNPGSVGQPRDRCPGAAWALLDTATGTVDLRREAYDSLPTAAEARRFDPGLPYLWTVLERR